MNLELNENRALNPQPGDFWRERLDGVCIVLEVTESKVTLCREKIITNTGWQWDLSKLEIMTKNAFRKWLSYKTSDGYRANVSINTANELLVNLYKETKHLATVLDSSKNIQLELDLYV